MDYYSSLTLITIMALLSTMFSVIYDATMQKKTKKTFLICFDLIILATVCEWLAKTMDGVAGVPQIVLYALKLTEMFLGPLIPLIMLYVMDDCRRAKFLNIFAVLYAAALLLSSFKGLIFYFDSENIYRYGAGYWLYIALYMINMVVLFIGSVIFSKEYQNRNVPSLLGILTFAAVGIAIHIVWVDIQLDWLVVSISFIMFLHHTRVLSTQIEPLTHLLDRGCMDTYLSTLSINAVVIIFDIDCFKMINDQYGHDVGDECLKIVARIIKKNYKNSGYSFRMGGDEFCTVITKFAEKFDRLNESFHEELRNTPYKEITMTVSMGYGVYTPGINRVEDALKAADTMMYENKQKARGEKA